MYVFMCMYVFVLDSTGSLCFKRWLCLCSLNGGCVCVFYYVCVYVYIQSWSIFQKVVGWPTLTEPSAALTATFSQRLTNAVMMMITSMITMIFWRRACWPGKWLWRCWQYFDDHLQLSAAPRLWDPPPRRLSSVPHLFSDRWVAEFQRMICSLPFS